MLITSYYIPWNNIVDYQTLDITLNLKNKSALHSEEIGYPLFFLLLMTTMTWELLNSRFPRITVSFEIMTRNVFLEFYLLFSECNSGYYGRNCGEFCGGCISNLCDTFDGLCTNTTGCQAGYLYEEYCNKSA